MELLVVIAIIGVLAGVIMVAIQSARIKGRDAKRIGDMRQMATALQQYYITHGSYPTGTGSIAGTALNGTAFDGSAEPMVPNYIPIIPQAPEPADGDCAGSQTKGGNNYWYEAPEAGNAFTLTFCMGKNISDDVPAGIRTLTPDGLQ